MLINWLSVNRVARYLLQLWLKEVTGEEAIEFLSKAPLPKKASNILTLFHLFDNLTLVFDYMCALDSF